MGPRQLPMPHTFQAFIHGLAETGYRVGENVAIEYRWADSHYEQYPGDGE